MTEPIFWLGCSILLVAVCLAVALAVAIPALIELSRAARSIEKLADTLQRELPPTLEALRLASLELSELSDDLSGGVQSAGQIVRQVDESLTTARHQAQVVQVNTQSVLTGVKAAWQSWTRPNPKRRAVPADIRNNARDVEMLDLPPRSPEYLEYEGDIEYEGKADMEISRSRPSRPER